MSVQALAARLAARAAGTDAYRGRDVATSYGDVAGEWRALDSDVGLLDFSFLTDIIATGGERIEFLQGQVSQDVARIGAGEGGAALALSAQGRVQALLALYAREDSVDIVVDAAHHAAARARLEQFLVADDVEFDDGAEHASIGLVGPRATELLAAVGAAPHDRPWWTSEAEMAGTRVVLRARGDLRVPCVEIVVEGDAEVVWRELEGRGARPAGARALEVVRVESGLPLVGIDVDDARIAVEARLEWAIHFNKGCYVGQEVVERAVSRGRLHRELCLLAADAPLHRGARVVGGAQNDVVTSVVDSPRLGHIALAYVPLERTSAGSDLRLELDGDGVAARVLEWPRARRLQGR